MALGFGLKPRAVRALFHLADFVEQQNTIGSGQRFLEKFLKAIDKQVVLFLHIKYVIIRPSRSEISNAFSLTNGSSPLVSKMAI